MKKIITLLSFSVFSTLTANAQDKTQPTTTEYNRWSIDLNGGLSRPTQPMTPGYYTPDFSPFSRRLRCSLYVELKIWIKN